MNQPVSRHVVGYAPLSLELDWLGHSDLLGRQRWSGRLVFYEFVGINDRFVAGDLHSKLSFSMLYNANRRKQSHNTVLMGTERVLSFERASKKVATMIDSDCAGFLF